MHKKKGFTLIELLIFSAIFAVMIGSFITILVVVVTIQAKESASSEAEQQGQFLIQQFQYYINSARLIDMTADSATTTLTLREPFASSSLDPTVFSLSSGTVYLKQGAGALQPLTSNRVTVSNLLFTRHYNVNSSSSPFGTDSVSYSFTVSASTTIATQYAQSFESSASVLSPVPKIVMIQQAKIESNNATSTSLAKAYTTANDSGDLLLAVVANQNLVTSTIADSDGNTWTQIASTTYPAYSEELALFAALNSNKGANTTTVTFGGTGARNASLFIYEYRGAATSGSFDTWGTQAQPSTTFPMSVLVNPTSSVELLFGIDDNASPTSTTASAGVGYTLETSSTAGYNTQLFVEDQDQYIAGSVDSTWSYSVYDTSTAAIATFK